MRSAGWIALLGLAALAPAAGCDWRDADNDAQHTPVLSIGAPDKFGGASGNFGRILLPITAPSEREGVQSRLLVSASTGTGLALLELDAAGHATTTNIASAVLNGTNGPMGFPLNALAEIPGPKPGKVLLGAARLMNGSSAIYTVTLGGTFEGKVVAATLTRDADPYLGLGVAAGNFQIGDPAEPELILASADVLRVYVDGKSPAAWSWSDDVNGPGCPLRMPGNDDPQRIPQRRPILVGHFWGDGSDLQIAISNFGDTGKGSLSFFGLGDAGLACLGTITGTEASFGQALDSGDFNGDPRTDLLVGAPPHAYALIGPLGPASAGIALPADDQAVRFGSSVASINLDGVAGADMAIVGDPEAAVSGALMAGTAQIISFEGSGAATVPKKWRLLTAHDSSENAAYGVAVTGLPFCGTCPAGSNPRLPLVGAGTRVLTYFTLGTDRRKP